jgi:hypothetical protein
VRTELVYCMKNRYYKIGLFLLFMGFVFYTFSYFFGLQITVSDYKMASMTFVPFSFNPDRTLSALHFWFGTAAPSRLPEQTFSFFESVFSCLIIPILLALFNLDSYLQDVKGNVKNIRIVKSGKFRYYFTKLFSVCLVSFFSLFVLQLLQFIVGWGIDNFTKYISQPTSIQAYDILVVIVIAARISLFYAVILSFSFSISLYLEKIPATVYALPLIVTIATAIYIKPQPYNLAFLYSNLRDDSLSSFYSFTLILIGISFLLVLIKTKKKDQIA